MALYWVLGAAWVAAGDALLAYCVTEPQQAGLLADPQGLAVCAADHGALAWWLLARMSRGQGEIGAARAPTCCTASVLRLALDGSGSGLWDWDLLRRRSTHSPGLVRLLRTRAPSCRAA